MAITLGRIAQGLGEGAGWLSRNFRVQYEEPGFAVSLGRGRGAFDTELERLREQRRLLDESLQQEDLARKAKVLQLPPLAQIPLAQQTQPQRTLPQLSIGRWSLKEGGP